MKKILLFIIPACTSCNNTSVPKWESVTPKEIKKEIITVDIKKDSTPLKPVQNFIVNINGAYTLVLPEELKKIIEAYRPNFKPWSKKDFVKSIDGNVNYYKCSLKQLPYAVAGEFNGDSVTDLILSGSDKRNSLILGVISLGDSYNVIAIEKGELVDPKYDWIDSENNKGFSSCIEHFSSDKGPKAKKFSMIKNDAFIYETYGKGSAIYWYEEGKFKKAAFSD